MKNAVSYKRELTVTNHDHAYNTFRDFLYDGCTFDSEELILLQLSPELKKERSSN